jgi:hypothetical protein
MVGMARLRVPPAASMYWLRMVAPRSSCLRSLARALRMPGKCLMVMPSTPGGSLVAHHRTQRRFYIVRITNRLHQTLCGCGVFGFGHRRDRFDFSRMPARRFTPARYRARAAQADVAVALQS